MECLICKHNGMSVNIESGPKMTAHVRLHHNMDAKTYYDKYVATPDSGHCPECGADTRFISITRGYLEFCSRKCAARHIAADADRQEHKKNETRQTLLEKYQVDNVSKIEAVKSKRRETMKARYGFEYYSKCGEYKEKMQATCMERYNEISYARTAEFRERVIRTNNEKYGVDYPGQIKSSGKRDDTNPTTGGKNA